MGEVVDTLERFDVLELVEAQAKEVAVLLRESKHTVAFTGAGISAASGIPTYRGSEGIDNISELQREIATVKETKVAVDEGGTVTSVEVITEVKTKKERKSKHGARNQVAKIKAAATKRKRTSSADDADDGDSGEDVEPVAAIKTEVQAEEEEDVDFLKLKPTFTHKALFSLFSHGKLNYMISQNCDGLHVKSGFPTTALTELHGNVFVEYCEKCFKEYRRDFCVDVYSTEAHKEPWHVTCPQCKWNHYTGRLCDSTSCRGKLRDTIVNFGDDLHDAVLGGLPRAFKEGGKADVCLALGSSLTVHPANKIPLKSSKVIICNLQQTDLDANKKSMKIWATTDQFFHFLLKELNIAVEDKSLDT
jgi:NAD-dependent SIR2 family protein deacetylase